MIHWELYREIEFYHTVYAQPIIRPGEREAQTPRGFWNTNGSSNLGQMTRPYYDQQKKRELQNCVKLEESEKKDKYSELARELKKKGEHGSKGYIGTVTIVL